MKMKFNTNIFQFEVFYKVKEGFIKATEHIVFRMQFLQSCVLLFK